MSELRDAITSLLGTWEAGSNPVWVDAARQVRDVFAQHPEADDVATLLMNGYENAVGPIFDTADGMRADLERRGWSPTMAEAMAASWLQAGLTSLW